VLAFLTDGNAAVAIAPVLGISLVYLLWKTPLRYPTFVLLFLGLTVESPVDGFASGKWETPLHTVRSFFWMRWNQLLPVPPLVFSGMDLMLVLLIGIALHRRATGSRIDGDGLVDTASPLLFFTGIAIFGALLCEAWGVLRGGSTRIAFIQVQHVVYPALYFLLFHYAFRGPQDHATIARVVVWAACIRAATAFGIRYFVIPNDYDRMPTATTHSDSLLFASAFCLCIIMAFELRDKKRVKLCALVLPILILGMVANNRRLVWVEIAEALIAIYLVMPMSRLKRRVLRYLLFGVPAFTVYLLVGWDSVSGKLFSAARTVRSLFDSNSDASTAWRDWENFDLVTTFQSSPLLGVGYGHQFLQPHNVSLDIAGYELEPYQPHNSFLGLWAFGGVVGFTLVWMVVVVGAFFAVRCYKCARGPTERAASLASLGVFVANLALCYGDVGFGSWESTLLGSVALCVVGKLALVTGAWPSKVNPTGARLTRGLGRVLRGG
jgi:hypothetical protein